MLCQLQVLAYLESVPSCNTTSGEVAKLISSLKDFAPLVTNTNVRQRVPHTHSLTHTPHTHTHTHTHTLQEGIKLSLSLSLSHGYKRTHALTNAGRARGAPGDRALQHSKPAANVGSRPLCNDRQGIYMHKHTPIYIYTIGIYTYVICVSACGYIYKYIYKYIYIYIL